MTWLLPCCGMLPVMGSYGRRTWLYKTQDKVITFIFIAVVSHVAGNFLGSVPPFHSAPGSSHIVGEKDGVSSETRVLDILHLSPIRSLPCSVPSVCCAFCSLSHGAPWSSGFLLGSTNGRHRQDIPGRLASPTASHHIRPALLPAGLLFQQQSRLLLLLWLQWGSPSVMAKAVKASGTPSAPLVLRVWSYFWEPGHSVSVPSL